MCNVVNVFKYKQKYLKLTILKVKHLSKVKSIANFSDVVFYR